MSEPASIGTLARLWVAANGIWGAKWTKHLGELPVDDSGALTLAGAIWAKGLAGFGERRIMAAVEKFALSAGEWPPNLPEMRRECFDIPALREVRRDLDERSHGFTRMVLEFIDHWAYGRADRREADRMLADAYELAVYKRMQGAPFPEPPAGELEHKPAKPNPSSPEKAAEAMQEIARELCGKDLAAGVDK